MQNKSYKHEERLVVPVNGVNTNTFQNLSERKENFHGIRWSGRIITDDLVEGFSSGFLTLFCLPTAGQAVPNFFTELSLNDNQDFIIAVMPWMVFNQGAGTKENAHTASMFDFNFEIKTSRTCSRGGRIIAQLTNDVTSTNLVVFNMLFSTFRTIT